MPKISLAVIGLIALICQGCNLLSNHPSADGSLFSPLFNLSLIGQPNFTTNIASATGQYQPTGGYLYEGKLFVSDSGNNRVLIWNSIPSSALQSPDLVLGQSSPYSFIGGSPSASTMFQPNYVYYNGTQLFVVDNGNNRVLAWNSFPTQDGQAADFVLGQPDFTTGSADTGGISGNSMNFPAGVYVASNQLFVGDAANNRVLVWSPVPTSSVDATFALGQSTLTTDTVGNDLSGLQSPGGITSDGTQLFVGDSYNNRVIVWSTVPTSRVAADYVLGQADSTSNVSGVGYSRMNLPWGVFTDGTRLCVSNYNNNRVMVWNTVPTVTTNADFVLGQPDQSTWVPNIGGESASTMDNPIGVYGNAERVYVADQGNSRTLVWTSPPTALGQPADLIMGQPVVYYPAMTSYPSGVYSDGTRLFVADTEDNRVLVWKTMPQSNSTPPDFVLGQPDFTTNTVNTGGVSASSLNIPETVYSDGKRLFVVDNSNHRVLGWNHMPSTNGEPADFVLGQPDFTTNSDNTGGISASSMKFPAGVYSDGTHFFVADANNDRVLIWNGIPTSNVPADFELGQPGFTTNAAASSATQMSGPSGVYSHGTQLFVSDYWNNRVLVWNTIPTSNDAPADFVLGQPDLTSNTANNGGISSQTLNEPGEIYGDGTHFFIADAGNNRVLQWNGYPHSARPADKVIGQTNFTSSTSALTAKGLSWPWAVYSDSEHLFIADEDNSRVVVVPIP